MLTKLEKEYPRQLKRLMLKGGYKNREKSGINNNNQPNKNRE
jgi:hypothetical protein